MHFMKPNGAVIDIGGETVSEACLEHCLSLGWKVEKKAKEKPNVPAKKTPKRRAKQ